MTIFNSEIPVVSAVGHETDVTISDFIADLRAPTPSAAAELVAPDKSNLDKRISELDRSLRAGFERNIEKLNQNLKQISKRLQDPRKKIQEAWLRLDDFSGRLERSLLLRAKHASDLLLRLRRHLDALAPQTRIKEYNKQLQLKISNLLKNISILISNNRSSFREQTVKLEAMNPLAILNRGYSVTRSLPDRQVILHPGQVSINQEVEILLAGGFLLCGVKGKSTYGEEDV
jgi:exodeoxyribonuclease VII large subunit